ncbi:TonB-dependent receptor [Shewanella aquimarina]|uniref:TonB-dependent receptor n=1 Tax=Shewanella aquimarina TaxID=260365 RepID=UPI002014F86A|nr:TonB-dependent receptor [Shewanella aquimarina]MCL2911823.1 TonB-dependent receptor [Shewanella aquimarina]
MDKRYLLTAFSYALLGLMLGLYMAASHDHGQLVTHAHIMMIGFLISFSYALCYRLWLEESSGCHKGGLVTAQFWLHQLGTLGVAIGLFLLYGEFVALEVVDPFLAIASFSVFGGVVLMMVQLLKAKQAG